MIERNENWVLPREVIDWDLYFIGVSFDVSKRSKDPNTQCGAVLVDEENRIISTGYNGGCRKIDDKLVDWSRPNKYSWVIHAEENAMWMSNRRDLEGCKLYVNGRPCSRCMLRIAHSGIGVVVYGWQKIICCNDEDWRLACQIAKLASVELKEIKN